MILRFREDILKVECITANITIIAFATKIYIYQKQALQKVISITPATTIEKPIVTQIPEIEKSIFSWSMDILGEDLRRLAYV